MATVQSTSSFILGGLLLGIWLYVALFQEPEWGLWGAVGLALAGGLMAARVANPGVRIAVWVTLGIALGVLVMASIDQAEPAILAVLLTFAGGALIVTALPRDLGQPGTAAPPPQVVPVYVPGPHTDDDDVAPSPPPRQRRKPAP